MDNPLPPGAFDPVAEPVMALNAANELNTNFVKSLDLDPGQYSNYEPLFLTKLKEVYVAEFAAVVDNTDAVYLDNLAKIYLSPRFLELLRMVRQGRYGNE
jgi:hypothetical protein